MNEYPLTFVIGWRLDRANNGYEMGTQCAHFSHQNDERKLDKFLEIYPIILKLTIEM